MQQLYFKKLLPWYFFTAAFESLLAIVKLFSIPAENGISLSRLAMIAALGVIFFMGINWGNAARRDFSRFDSLFTTPVISSSALLFLTFSLILFLLRYLNPEETLPYYERLSPILWVLWVISGQSVVFFLLARNGFQIEAFLNRKEIYRSAILPFSILIFIFIFVAATKIGIKADTGYWGEPGPAIQGWQFVAAIVVGTFVLLTTNHKPQTAIASIVLPALLYVIAATLWLSVPLEVLRNSFYSPISPPLDIPLPYSDAAFYDYLSQSLLIGTDYLNGIPPRPYYVFFLGVLHYFFGQNYPAIITAQTLVLAFFPVILYFLGKKLHSPAAGTVIALFAIFRELVSLWISSNIRTSNVKMLTTDFPTAMALALLCLVLIWWLEKPNQKSALVAGGFFGLVLLFRTQSLFVMPFVLIVASFVFQNKRSSLTNGENRQSSKALSFFSAIRMVLNSQWLVSMLAFGFAMVVAILPWMTHNKLVSGHFTFDDPRQSAVIYGQYSKTDNLDITKFNPETDSVGERMVSFTLENPGFVANFIAAHFLNTEIGGLLALPLIKPFESLSAPVNIYWGEWNGSLEWYNAALLILYLTIIAIGISTVFLRAGWAGIIPIAVSLGYALSNGIARFSSWRYNLPVDWVPYFYFGIGAIEILGGIAAVLGVFNGRSQAKDRIDRTTASGLPSSIAIFIFIPVCFALIGSLPWAIKGVTDIRYTASDQELILKIENAGYAQDEIAAFMNHPNAIITEGRLLYPRLYHRGDGMASANPWASYAVQNRSRIGFALLNESFIHMNFATKERLDFPQGADAVILACAANGYYDARVIIFEETHFQSASLTDPCP